LDLVPKKENPNNFGEFNPILFCNFIHHILAKILAMRIKKIILEGISKEQFKFMKGRLIHDSIGVVKEGIHTMKIKIKTSLWL
jgi:hypothetical protein